MGMSSRLRPAGSGSTRVSAKPSAATPAAVTCTLLAPAAIMPPAWAAVNYIPNHAPDQAPAAGVVTAGGITSWQITVIALGAALVAATAAVWLDRARAARRAAHATTT
jgi:hypothetical protein